MSKLMSQAPVYRKIRPRIESLSDLVFGLALSIGSIVLIGNIPRDASSLYLDVLYFAFSFLIVIMIWSGYTRTMAYLPIESEGVFYLNVGLLFVVALEPFLFYVLISEPSSTQAALSFINTASQAYGLDVGAMYVILAGFAYMVKVEEKRKGDPEQLGKRFKRLAFWLAVGGAMFLVSALPYFWIQFAGSFVRFYFWYASFAVFFARSFSTRKKALPGNT